MHSLLYFSIALLAWALFPVFSAFGLKGMGPVTFATIAQCVSAVSSLIILFSIGYSKKSNTHFIKRLFAYLSLESWLCIVITGLLYAVISATFVLALTYTNKATATIIMESWPIFAMLLSGVIVGKKDWKKITLIDTLIGFLAFTGVIILVLGGSPTKNTFMNFNALKATVTTNDLIGAGLALLCALSIVLSSLLRARASHKIELSEKIRPKHQLIASTFSDAFSRLFSIPAIFVFYIFFGEPLVFTGQALGFSIITGFLCYSVCNIFYVLAVLTSKSPNFHVYWFMMPILSVLFLWAFGLEELNVIILISMFMIVTSNMILSYKNTITHQDNGLHMVDDLTKNDE